jgi:hypothetical protein
MKSKSLIALSQCGISQGCHKGGQWFSIDPPSEGIMLSHGPSQPVAKAQAGEQGLPQFQGTDPFFLDMRQAEKSGCRAMKETSCA